ncbi:MAG TPA: zinc ribbon domain-containing protein [Kiritimatiellia bacterium]|nr:zinc ribbon domain-containing protein [Kiritimatiellia bacterium]
MPIYEYTCSACGRAFEHLARTLSDTPGQCPACGSKKISKQFSTFAAAQARPKGCGCCASEAACPAVRSGGCGCAGACGGH